MITRRRFLAERCGSAEPAHGPGGTMNIRAALTVVLALVLVFVALVAEAQQLGKAPTIGFLVPRLDPDCKATPMTEAFLQGLRDYGHVPGHTVTMDRRCYVTADQIRNILTDFVARKVDVIVTANNEPTEAAQRATKTIPIVAHHTDPVGAGLVSSLAHPGGNVTGLSTTPGPEVAAKRLDLLKQMAPRITRVAVFFEGSGPLVREQMEGAARTLRLTLQPVVARTVDELGNTLDAIVKRRSDAVVFQGFGGIAVSQRRRIIDWARQNQLAMMCPQGFYVQQGCLMSYGVNIFDLYRRLGGHVAKVLKGAKPADLPIEQPTKLELMINLNTAKALGLTIPPALLIQTDQVIE